MPDSCQRPLASTSAVPATSRPVAASARRAPAVGEDRGGDPAREQRQVAGQRPHRLGWPMAEHAGERPREPGHRQRRADEHRSRHAPAARGAHQRPADERERGVERDLDAQRPHRRVELAARRREDVLEEHREHGQAPGVGLATVAAAGQQRERAGHRDPVGGSDAGDAPQRELPERRHRALPARRGDPRAGEQEAREDEEQPDGDAELADDRVDQVGAPGPVCARVHPDVQAHHREGGQAAQAVEAGQAGSGRGSRSGHEGDSLPRSTAPHTTRARRAPGPRGTAGECCSRATPVGGRDRSHARARGTSYGSRPPGEGLGALGEGDRHAVAVGVVELLVDVADAVGAGDRGDRDRAQDAEGLALVVEERPTRSRRGCRAWRCRPCGSSRCRRRRGCSRPSGSAG